MDHKFSIGRIRDLDLDQARQKGGGGSGKLSQALQRLGAQLSLKNIKCTRVRHFEKKNSKIFSPEGPSKNVFPDLAVALYVFDLD